MNRSYSELMMIDDYDDRLTYLRLHGMVGMDTFGADRYLNQKFYKSKMWRQTRNKIIVRDNGCDLGVDGFDISGNIFVHHINPITPEDIIENNPCLYDPENLICTSDDSHNYIHYGRQRPKTQLITRSKNDQAPWLK